MSECPFLSSPRLIAIAVMFASHRDILPMCPNGHLLSIYYIGMLVLLSLHIVTDLAILLVSMRGTIADDWPRRHMASLLYVKIPLFCPELSWTIMGTYWAFRESTGCELQVGTDWYLLSRSRPCFRKLSLRGLLCITQLLQVTSRNHWAPSFREILQIRFRENPHMEGCEKWSRT